MENDDEENKTTLGEVIAQIFGIVFFCYLAYGAVIEIYQEIERLT